MSNIIERLLAFKAAENWRAPDSGIAARHASAHLLVLLIYVLVLASFPRYAILQLVPLILLPAVLFQATGLPLSLVLTRLLWIEPFIIFVALMNPIFAREPVFIGGTSVALGWFIAGSLVIKSILTLTLALQMGLILGMGRLAGGLQVLKVPPVFIEVISLSYRYLVVLMEETLTLLRAYKLRAPDHEGVHYKQWGSFAGNLILRSFDRAVRIEQAMAIRGSGDYRTFYEKPWQWADSVYVGAVLVLGLVVRVFM